MQRTARITEAGEPHFLDGKSTDSFRYDSEAGLFLLKSTRRDATDSDAWCDQLSFSVVFSGAVFSTHILAFLI